MMKKKFKNFERRGLPGGPNEMFTYTTGIFSTEGYRNGSPDINNMFNLIGSGDISMEDVDFSVLGIDNLGNSTVMQPGKNYKYPGDMVLEVPMAQFGWNDIKQYYLDNKDNIQNVLDKASYIPVLGTAASLGSAAIDAGDAYMAYKDGDYETMKKELATAGTSALLGATPGGKLLKTGYKAVAKNIAKPLANTTLAHGFKTGVKSGVKDVIKGEEENPIIDGPVNTEATEKLIASKGIELPRAQYNIPNILDKTLGTIGISPQDIINPVTFIQDTLPKDEQAKLTSKIKETEAVNLNKAKQFAGLYMNSPRYKEMLGSSLGFRELDFPSRRRRNFKRLQDTELFDQDLINSGIAGYSRSDTGDIMIQPGYNDMEGIYDHEISHSIDRNKDMSTRGFLTWLDDISSFSPSLQNRLIPQKDINLMKSLQKTDRAKNQDNDEDFEYWDVSPVKFWKDYGKTQEEGTVNYFTEPTEVRARLNELRRSMYDQGVDIFNKEVKSEDLENDNIQSMPAFYNLEHFYGKDGILKMLNNISDATDMDEFKKMAKEGGSVSWQWKGKTYSGTLIPSMEDTNNRYARTQNGKIKTLPKGKSGLEVSKMIIGGLGLSKQQNGPGTDKGWRNLDVNVEGIKNAIRNVESADGTLMMNPRSTATGLYGQRFSEIKDLYKGSREDFSKDLDAQNEFFMMRLNEGIAANETTALLRDAFELTEEYKDQLGDKWNFSYEDVISLSNFLGRQGTREYFGDVIRDGKSLAQVYPHLYGANIKAVNKTPDQYLEITRKFYQEGGEPNTYKVVKGDNLSRIARNFGTTVSDIVSLNDIANPRLIQPDQILKLPENINPMAVDSAPSANTYTVKKGDNLSRIAKKYNTTYQRLAKINNINDPSFIRVGQQLILPEEYKEEVPLAEEQWISVDKLQKNTEDVNALADEDVIIRSQMINNPNQRYVVVDKKNQRLKLYHGDDVITDIEVATGSRPGDAQTVTKPIDVNEDGIITEEDKVDGVYQVDWSKGNLSTGAGRYTITKTAPTSGDYYNNAPAFTLANEQGIEVSTAIHGAPDYRLKYFDNDDINDNRSSNGCINGKCSDLQGLYDMGLPTGTPVFILPEDEGNFFEMVDGQAVLRMSRQNRKKYAGSYVREGYSEPFKGQGGNYTTNTLRYKPIRAKFDVESFQDDIFTAFDFNDTEELEKNTIPFINALVDNKKDIMKAAKIPSDVYNQIAKIAFGIYGAESNYGDTHSTSGNVLRGGAKLANKFFDEIGLLDGRSVSNIDTTAEGKVTKAIDAITTGIDDTLGFVRAPEELRIARDSDDVSLGFTQLRWSYVKNNPRELKALNEVGIYSKEDLLDPEKSAIATAIILGVRYNEQLTPEQKKNISLYLPTKWNNAANYPQRVKRNSKYIDFEQFDRMRSGGEVEDKLIYKNYINGMYENTKMESTAKNVYDKLNRKFLKQARELGLSPANYVMTYVVRNS